MTPGPYVIRARGRRGAVPMPPVARGVPPPNFSANRGRGPAPEAEDDRLYAVETVEVDEVAVRLPKSALVFNACAASCSAASLVPSVLSRFTFCVLALFSAARRSAGACSRSMI